MPNNFFSIEMWYMMNRIVTYSIVSMVWKDVFDTSWYHNELVLLLLLLENSCIWCVHILHFPISLFYFVWPLNTVICSQNICFSALRDNIHYSICRLNLVCLQCEKINKRTERKETNSNRKVRNLFRTFHPKIV